MDNDFIKQIEEFRKQGVVFRSKNGFSSESDKWLLDIETYLTKQDCRPIEYYVQHKDKDNYHRTIEGQIDKLDRVLKEYKENWKNQPKSED